MDPDKDGLANGADVDDLGNGVQVNFEAQFAN